MLSERKILQFVGANLERTLDLRQKFAVVMNVRLFKESRKAE
jgi:hypothetical protein